MTSPASSTSSPTTPPSSGPCLPCGESWRRWRSLPCSIMRMSGTLPLEWSGMNSIVEFSATNTQLVGTIPDSRGILPSLMVAALPGTEVTDCLP